VGRRAPNAGAGAGAFPGAGVGAHAGAAPPRRGRGVPSFRYIPAPRSSVLGNTHITEQTVLGEVGALDDECEVRRQFGAIRRPAS
jgi:hypothetical protein